MANAPIPEDDDSAPLGAAPTLPAGRGSRGSGRRGSGGSDGSGGRRVRRPTLPGGTKLVAIVLAIILLALVPMVVSGLRKTPRNSYGISYGGGPLEGSHFQRVVKPGSALFFNGFFDPLYLYPADQQNYIISKQVGVGASKKPDSVIAPTKDRVQIEYQVAAYFKLNIDRLRAFHEQLGLKYSAFTSSGWAQLLQDTFRQQIENALQEETRRYEVADIYGSADTLTTIQTRVQQAIDQRLRLALGQRFFCGPTYQPGGTCTPITFIIKKVDIPTSVRQAYEANRTSEVQILTKQNEIKQRQAEAVAVQALNKALQGDAGKNYVLLKAIESGKISFWVLPSDSGVTLQTPGSSASGSAPSTPGK